MTTDDLTGLPVDHRNISQSPARPIISSSDHATTRYPDLPITPAPQLPRSPSPDLPRAPAPLLPRSSNIYLCGMIGSGKTPIGMRLATRLRWPFYDLDREMDNDLGYSFHRLVQEQGWLKFREIEYGLCRRFSQMKNVVVALGGGTVRYAWNVDILRGTGVTVLLEADLKTLADRVRKADRPRVNSGVSLEEDLENIWSTAGHLYRQAADLVYRTDAAQDIDAEVADLLNLLAQSLPIPLV
jgi:shikimate kinase